MLAKKIAFFAALGVALLLTWFVMDTVSNIPAMTSEVSKQTADQTLQLLAATQNKQCVSDSDCMFAPASCSSCNCKFAAIAVKGAEAYISKRAEICQEELGAMKATCDMYCPMKPVCENQQCVVQSLTPPSGKAE